MQTKKTTSVTCALFMFSSILLIGIKRFQLKLKLRQSWQGEKVKRQQKQFLLKDLKISSNQYLKR